MSASLHQRRGLGKHIAGISMQDHTLRIRRYDCGLTTPVCWEPVRSSRAQVRKGASSLGLGGLVRATSWDGRYAPSRNRAWEPVPKALLTMGPFDC